MADANEYDSSLTNDLLRKSAEDNDDTPSTSGQDDESKPKEGGLVGDAKNPKAGGLIKSVMGSFKKGGTVPKTGPYKLHKGEEVLPKGRASEYRKLFEQRGKDGKHKWGK
jgi:hypothetical protein